MRWRSVLLGLTVGLISLLVGPVVESAAGETLPKGIVPTPVPEKISLRLRLDRYCFVPNERMTVRLDFSAPAYVYVWSIDSKGEVSLLFPNGFSRSARLGRGEYILPDSDKYSIVIEGPAGFEYVQAIASLYPIPHLEHKGDRPFVRLSTNAGKFAADLVAWLNGNLPEGSWATDWVGYSVSLGKLVISSWPPEAAVYVDGRFMGTTRVEEEGRLATCELWLAAGYHRVQVAKPGFGSRTQTVYLKACETAGLTFWLEQPARVRLDSRPRGAAISIDGRHVGETPAEIELAPGAHTIELRKSGYKVWSSQLWLASGEVRELNPRLPENLRPSARAEFTPANPLVGEEVLFDASRSYDPDGWIASYRWDFDGDGKADATGVKVAWTFARFGRHRVTLTVTDNDGAFDSVTLDARVRARPVAEFRFSPREPFVGDSVLFDASASHDPDGRIVAYRWEFGDGATGAGRSVEHIYKMPGTYTVTLVVRDDDGLEKATARSLRVVRGGVLAISSSPSGAKVYLDGKYIGVTPLTTPKLGEGTYRVTLKLEGYKDWSGEVAVPAQGEVAAELLPWGRLVVWSTPPGAQVYLDGRLEGETTAGGLVLYLEGEHLLRVVRCGFRSWSEVVTLESGEAQEVRAELQPIREISVETDPPGATILMDGRVVGETPARLELDPALGELVLQKEGYKRWSSSCITEEEIVVSLRRNEPPVAVISGPTGGTALVALELSAENSRDPDGTIVEHRWDLGDGTLASGKRVVHRYEKAGTYRVELTVVDEDGARGTAVAEIFIASHPPIVRLSGPARGRVGEELTFSAKGSHDPDGEIVGYRWDFGDGAAATGKTVTHRFERPGTYTIKLTVTDDHGVEAAETMTVEVLTGFALFLADLQELVIPRPFLLELNVGQNSEGVRSVGLAMGRWLMFGGSISFTGEEVPDFHEVPRQPWEGEVYNRGPELELYAALATPFLGAVALHAGLGVSFQERVHIAPMAPESGEAGLAPQRAVVKPNGYRDREVYLTLFAEISLKLEGVALGLGYHNRRGWTLGLGFAF